MLDSLDKPACRDVCGKLWKGLRFKLREARYTHCVILAGTYDVDGCKGSAEDIFNNITKLAKVAKDAGCETFVMTIPELREEKNHRNMENIRISANRLLMQSQSLSTIDLSTVVPYHRLPRTDRDRMWEPDGLHLRPAGYSKIAHAVAQRLRQGARVPEGAGDAPHVGKEVAAAPVAAGSDPRRSSQYPSPSAKIDPSVRAPTQPLAVHNPNLQQNGPGMPTGGAAAYAQHDPRHHQPKMQQQQAVHQQHQQAANPTAMQQEQAIQQQHVNITKAATPSFASPARFQNPGQAYLRYNVVWKPEEWIPKYRPREAGGMDAQVQKKGFAEKPEELVHAAEEFERDGYAPSGSPVKMIPSPFGSPAGLFALAAQVARGRLRCLGPGEILRGRLRFS